jgi:hypothetical protein
MPKLPSKSQKHFGVTLALKQTKALIASGHISNSKSNTTATKPKR